MSGFIYRPPEKEDYKDYGRVHLAGVAQLYNAGLANHNNL